MAKDPAFLFYPNDYLGGTMGMTFEEKGAYMELLMLQFNRGHMTKHMMAQTVGQLLDKLMDKFEKDEQGLYFNSRLELEKEKRKAFVNSRLNNKTGKNQYSKDGGHMTSHMENENRNRDIDKSEEVFFTIEHCLTVALNDNRWTKANKTNERELTEFNSLLEKRGIYKKNPLDYKTHFANWKRTGKKDIQEPGTSNQKYRLKKITA
jgi:uncharacterized protein YdaU (DUF1376 family)